MKSKVESKGGKIVLVRLKNPFILAALACFILGVILFVASWKGLAGIFFVNSLAILFCIFGCTHVYVKR